VLVECRGINVNAENFQGDTPLHKAVARDHIEAVKLLVAKRAKTTVQNREYKTALQSVVNNNAEMKKLLESAAVSNQTLASEIADDGDGIED